MQTPAHVRPQPVAFIGIERTFVQAGAPGRAPACPFEQAKARNDVVFSSDDVCRQTQWDGGRDLPRRASQPW